MAVKDVATGATLIKNIVEEKMWREAAYESYFGKFTGSGTNSIVQLKRDLKKGQGEKITFGLVKKLKGAGVGEGQPLKGNEETFEDTYEDITLSYRRHATKVNNRMSQQRSAYDLTMEAKGLLQTWAAEYVDRLHFDALFGSFTKVLYNDSSGVFQGTTTESTAKSAMSATNSVITPAMLSNIKTWAMTGGNRVINPIQPVKVDGDNYYVLLVHPNVANDLKQNSTYTQAMREAMERGKSNPLFKNATMIWDGVVVHSHERVPQGDDGGGASVHYSKGVLMGSQALIRADGMPVTFKEETDDYGETTGFAWGIITKVQKPQFNLTGTLHDFNSVGLYIACSNVTAQ